MRSSKRAQCEWFHVPQVLPRTRMLVYTIHSSPRMQSPASKPENMKSPKQFRSVLTGVPNTNQAIMSDSLPHGNVPITVRKIVISNAFAQLAVGSYWYGCEDRPILLRVWRIFRCVQRLHRKLQHPSESYLIFLARNNLICAKIVIKVLRRGTKDAEGQEDASRVCYP